MFVSYCVVLYGVCLCDVRRLCVGCLNVFVCLKFDLLCRGALYVVCVVLCLCACWLYVCCVLCV